MTDASEWQGRVGRKWADEWRRTDRSFSGLTERLLGHASGKGLSRALDIGCGAGELSLAIARGHPQAQVIGIDISEDLLAAARERGRHLGNASFELGDAAVWHKDGYRPDRLVSRHGVMFFPDPVAAFAHLHGIAADGARLVFSCFRQPAENPWASGIAGLLPAALAPTDPTAPDPTAPGPFAFADAERVRAILSGAGWREIAFEPVDYAYIAGYGDDPVEDAVDYLLGIGPAARAAAGLEGAERTAFVDRLRGYLADHRSGKLVAFPAAAWIVSAAH